MVECFDEIVSGNLVTSSTPMPLSGASIPVALVRVQNEDAANKVRIGNPASQDVILLPGGIQDFPVSNVEMLVVVAVAGTPRVNYLGFRTLQPGIMPDPGDLSSL